MNAGVLVFAALFAFAGYREAQRFQRQYGDTPWGWDAWVWSVVLFLSWVIGIVLLAIAERQRLHGLLPGSQSWGHVVIIGRWCDDRAVLSRK